MNNQKDEKIFQLQGHVAQLENKITHLENQIDEINQYEIRDNHYWWSCTAFREIE